MGLVGVVDRLGVGSPSSKAAALFGFADDALVIVPLGHCSAAWISRKQEDSNCAG